MASVFSIAKRQDVGLFKLTAGKLKGTCCLSDGSLVSCTVLTCSLRAASYFLPPTGGILCSPLISWASLAFHKSCKPWVSVQIFILSERSEVT